MQGISEIIDKRGELFDLLLIRIFMRTVHKRDFLPEIILCHRLVRDQHKILDHPRRHIALVRFYVNRPAAFIQNDLGLREIKIDRAALHALLSEDRCHMLHHFKHRNQFFILRAFCFILIRKDLLHARITHSAVYFDDRLRDLVVNDFSLFIDHHDTA